MARVEHPSVSDDILVPGGRDVRGRLDRAADASTDGDAPTGGDASTDADAPTGGDAPTGADACVVACPPHPQHRGHRGDERLRAVADELTARGLDCLRFDYGDWDEGYGERADVRHAVDWARERYDGVGLFGFSFGGTLSLLVASETREPGRRADTEEPADTGEPADTARPVDAVSALAPTARIDATLDAAAALPAIDCPTQVVYGTRDDTADWEPVVAAAEDADATTVELAADHFFVGQADTVADHVAGWLPDAIDRVGP